MFSFILLERETCLFLLMWQWGQYDESLYEMPLNMLDLITGCPWTLIKWILMSRLRYRTSQPTSNINIFHCMLDVKSLYRPCEFLYGGALQFKSLSIRWWDRPCLCCNFFSFSLSSKGKWKLCAFTSFHFFPSPNTKGIAN